MSEEFKVEIVNPERSFLLKEDVTEVVIPAFEGENYYEAALRELKEETSIVSVELVQEIDKKLTYILPDELIGIIWKGRFKGQIQKWFIMRFVGNESEININTKKPEFLDWKWIDLEDLTKIAVNFKLNVYKNLKQEISKILN